MFESELKQHYRDVRTRLCPPLKVERPKLAARAPFIPPIPVMPRRALIVEPSLVPRCPSIRQIVETVAREYNISVIEMVSQRRTAYVVRPRQVAMYLARTLTIKSLWTIGGAMGGRDHTTVLSACRKIENLRKIDPELNSKIEGLITALTESHQ